jgi:hypothetical protein
MVMRVFALLFLGMMLAWAPVAHASGALCVAAATASCESSDCPCHDDGAPMGGDTDTCAAVLCAVVCTPACLPAAPSDWTNLALKAATPSPRERAFIIHPPSRDPPIPR